MNGRVSITVTQRWVELVVAEEETGALPIVISWICKPICIKPLSNVIYLHNGDTFVFFIVFNSHAGQCFFDICCFEVGNENIINSSVAYWWSVKLKWLKCQAGRTLQWRRMGGIKWAKRHVKRHTLVLNTFNYAAPSVVYCTVIH